MQKSSSPKELLLRYGELVYEAWQNSVLFGLGATVGSFLNVVILRKGIAAEEAHSQLPATLNGRSRCPACGKQLSALELIPIVSWLIQAGQCRACRTPLSIQYPLVELAAGLLAVALLAPSLIREGEQGFITTQAIPLLSPLSGGDISLAVLDFSAAALLIVLFVVDLKTFLLPDKFLWPLTAVVVMHTVVRIMNNESPITAPLWGALTGAGFLLLLWLATRGRGIGFGDVKLMIPLGLRFGLLGTTALLFIAFTAGGIYGTALLATRRATMKTAIPFGPFLIGAALLLMLIPDLPQRLLTLLGWYW